MQATAWSLAELAKMSADPGGDDIDKDTERRLVESIETGDEARVVEILDRFGWNVLHNLWVLCPFECLGEQERGTLLHVACWYRQSKLVKLFLEKGANPDEESTGMHRYPLHVSAERGDEETCALLISSGCTVDAVDVHGLTPLIWATVHGEDHVVELLIKSHADINHQSHSGATPLHYASYYGRNNTVQLLVNSGAGIDCLDNTGHTPFHDACRAGEARTVKLLMSLGADVTFDRNPEALCAAVNDGHLETARVLLSNIPNPALVSDMLRGNLHKALAERSLELLSFVCAHGALDAADDEVKMEAAELAMESISHNSPTTTLSTSLDSTSLQNAFQQATEQGAVHAAFILVSLGALRRVTDDVLTNTLRLAVSEGSVELALAVFRSRPLSTNDKELFSDLLDLAVNEESPQLALAVCHTTCATSKDSEKALLSQDEVLDLILKKEPSAELVTGVCQDATVLDAVGAQTANSVLSFALQKKSANLALIACEACTLTKETVPGSTLDILVQLMLSTLADEPHQPVRLEEREQNAEKQKMASDMLQLGLKFDSVELVLAVVAVATACVTKANVTLARLLQFALHHALVELAVNVCKAGALDRAGIITVNDVLALALKTSSVELTFIAIQSDGVLADERAPDLMQAATDMALDISSVQLAIALCQNVEFSHASAPTVRKMLQLGLDCEDVQLVLAVVSNAAAPASALSETLLSLLQFAVKHQSPRLAILVCNAGAITKADHQLLNAALKMAIDLSSYELLFLLSSAGVLQQSSDKVKEKALHQAAIAGDLQLADHCISSGVLNGADDWDAPTAIDIAMQRGHSRLAVKLTKALDNHKLLSLGQMSANTVLIRVVGSPGAGKSTLVKSLKTSRLRGFFRWESQPDEDD